MIMCAGVLSCVVYRNKNYTFSDVITFSSHLVLPNPPSQLSLWEETGVPGENLRLSAER